MKIIILTSSSTLKFGGGMDRVIANANDELGKQFNDVIIVSANTFYNLLVAIYKILKSNPFEINYIVFNSLASIRIRYNKYWKIIYYIGKLFRIKNILYWHEMPLYYENFRSKNNKEAIIIENKFKNKNILHLTCSTFNTAIVTFFNNKSSIHTINNCVEIPKHKANLLYNNFTVVTVGSIQEIKGTDIWTEVAIKVCSLNPSIKFIWCGGESDKKMYQECMFKIKKASLENRIILLGQVEDAKHITMGCHLFFSSSRVDTFPLSVLEAMCYGKNIIHYESGGVVEQVGEFGICIKNFDIDKTVEKILEQYDLFTLDANSIYNQNLYNRFIENYTPKIFVEKFKNALSS